jgi:hypothetical protein
MYLKGVDFFLGHKYRMNIVCSDTKYNCGSFKIKTISEQVRLLTPFAIMQYPAHTNLVTSLKHQLAVADNNFRIDIEAFAINDDPQPTYTKIYNIEMGVWIRDFRITENNEISIYANPKSIRETHAKKLHTFCR